MSESDFLMIMPLGVGDTSHVEDTGKEVPKAVLNSTTVPEAVASTYSSGTTYALGDRAGLAPVYGSAQTVYESIQAGNTNHALTNTSWWKLVGNIYPPYASGSSCPLDGIVSSIGTDVHLLYQSLVAANTGNPLTDATKWLPYGATNARKMFDDVYGSQTTNAESIVFNVTPGVGADSLFLGNLAAESVTISQAMTGYTKTITLNSYPVDDYFVWTYPTSSLKESLVVTDIPLQPTYVLTITISNPGKTAKCGICSLGKYVFLGTTQWGVSGGIISYSGTTTDIFGNTKFLKRANAKKLNLDVFIADGSEDEAYRRLNLFTDTPMVFVGHSTYNMTMAYGVLGDWSVHLVDGGSMAQIEIRGLI